MRGAFLVGVMKTFHSLLGVSYFDTIFSTSVGVFEQAFFASNQPYMENTWKEYVHGRQLINFLSPIQGKPILDLDYLVGLFQSDTSRLDVETMINSHPKLFTVVADYETREPVLMDLKQGPIFDIMRATSAVPYLYNREVLINNRRYIDSLVVPKRKFRNFLKASLVEYEEVPGVSSYSNDKDLREIEKTVTPSRMPLWGALDINRKRIIETIKQGEVDTIKYINKHKLAKI